MVKHIDFGLPYLIPKRMVDRVSDAFEALGEQQHSKAVLEFPPYMMRVRRQSIKI
jgi:16S rRNA C967 or C1407 C5-methylase (RsmB/RsmF family)